MAYAGYDVGIEGIGEIFTSKRQAVIAVIDTYIDIKHYAFENIWTNDEEEDNNIDDHNNGYVDDVFGWNFCDNSSEFFDKSNETHGTFIVEEICGNDKSNNYSSPLINTDYKVMCLQAISNRKNEDIKNLIEAIKYADNNGASICCLCFSMNSISEELYLVMKNSSMLFIVAAGNEAIDMDESEEFKIFPAKYDLDNIIVVTDMRSDGKISEVANWGKNSVDIAAPGTDIVSTVPNDKFTYSSGTSFAVPLVACEAALLYQNAEDLMTALEIKDIIIKNVTYNSNLVGKVKSNGFINIYKALSKQE